MWFYRRGDARLGECATEGCWQAPIYRLEAGGIASNYCSACRSRIDPFGCEVRKAALEEARWICATSEGDIDFAIFRLEENIRALSKPPTSDSTAATASPDAAS